MKIDGCVFTEDMIIENTRDTFFATYKGNRIAVASILYGFSTPKDPNLIRFRIEVFNTEVILVDTWAEFETIEEAIAFALKESGLTTKKD